MDVTLNIAGWTWHWSLTPTGSDETEFEPYQDAGTIGSERIVAETSGFEDPGSAHQFSPGEGDEDRRPRLGFGG